MAYGKMTLSATNTEGNSSTTIVLPVLDQGNFRTEFEFIKELKEIDHRCFGNEIKYCVRNLIKLDLLNCIEMRMKEKLPIKNEDALKILLKIYKPTDPFMIQKELNQLKWKPPGNDSKENIEVSL